MPQIRDLKIEVDTSDIVGFSRDFAAEIDELIDGSQQCIFNREDVMELCNKALLKTLNNHHRIESKPV